MKYAIILPDGAADEPTDRLGGQTPLEVARKPYMDWIASNGISGLAVTVPAGFSPGSDVATLSLFGYDPRTCYSGRAPLEAAAKGITAEPNELIFRCNFITVADGRLEDFTAGHISQTEADRLIAALNDRLGDSRLRFHAGVSYRNLMIAAPAGEVSAVCVPPHDVPGEPIEKHLPKGPGSEWVCEIMQEARDVLANHEINQVRRDLGENPTTDIWLWGYGRPRKLDAFAEKFGVRAAAIAAVDLIRGIAKTVGMRVIDVPGITGYLDTDYTAKGKYAVAALDEVDLIIVHVEAPDEAGHLGDPREKVLALERIDQHVVGPLLEKLRTFDQWRVLIAPDHPTPVDRRVHTASPPPFCMAGAGLTGSPTSIFSESTAASTGLVVNPAHELIAGFLREK